MLPRETFIKALKREPVTGHVPTFELVFFLTMESIGRVHPSHRNFEQWIQMSRNEKRAQFLDMAKSYVEIAEKYHHSAIFVHPNPGSRDTTEAGMSDTLEILKTIREISGDKYFLMMHGDPTLSIPDGDEMVEFSAMMYEEPETLHERTRKSVDYVKRHTDILAKYPELLDGFALCSDYCFNTNPFFSREMTGEFIVPYLTDIISFFHDRGYLAIKHTDGNIMPIADLLVGCKPDALHSLDPQGGVDLGECKRLFGDQVCLIGNVNCGLMQTGTEEELAADVRRALRDGMPGYGYIFSTSNCAYTGLELSRYELMNRIWQEEGVYPQDA